MSISEVLAVADAVLYEGYLLYPYRATSMKNQARWQFGVLGPQDAAETGMGEDSAMRTQCLVRSGSDGAVSVHLRFLQLQVRTVDQVDPRSSEGYRPVAELCVEDRVLVPWDEATECHQKLGRFVLSDLAESREVSVEVPAHQETEAVESEGRLVGRLVRHRAALSARVRMVAEPTGDAGVVRLCISVVNVAPPATDGHQAIRTALIGTHLVLVGSAVEFISLLDPPPALRSAADECRQYRCWPVLAGRQGGTDVMLVSPIILYDYPALAPESVGALFDSTEIDEILTLRVMTLTDQEKAEARATDPAAAAVIDRCERMSVEDLQRLHGVLRDPHAPVGSGTGRSDWSSDRGVPGRDEFDPFEGIPTFVTPEGDGARGPDLPWWDPGAEATVSPATDAVVIAGVSVANGSSVRVHPHRNGDAQDLFFADQVATVTAVFSDVDGGTHIGVVLDGDPAADLHQWYGRYLYFAPDELEPLGPTPVAAERSDRRATGQGDA